MLSSSTTTIASHKPNPSLSRRELGCVVNHISEPVWKQTMQVLNIKPALVKISSGIATQKSKSECRFDSIKSFATASDLQEMCFMVGGNVTDNPRNKMVQQLLRSGYTSLAVNIETGMTNARVPSNFLCNF